MQPYNNSVAKKSGAPMAGVSITVTNAVSGAVATLYTDNGVTTQANPMTSDANGNYGFYAADGRYVLTFSGSTFTTFTIPVLLEDPADGSAALSASAGSALVGHIASGAGAVATTAQAKLRETVSITDFGTPGTADVTPLLTLAAAGGYKVVTFPAGSYYFDTTFTNNLHGLRIKGAGSNCTNFYNRTVGGDCLSFVSPDLSSATSFLNNCGVEGVTISRITDADAGAPLRIKQCNGFALKDVVWNNHVEGFVQEGGQFNNLEDFKGFVGTTVLTGAVIADSAILHLKEATIDGGLYATPYSTTISNFKMSGSKKVETCIRIDAGDGIIFSDFYIGNGETSLLKMQVRTDGQYIAGVVFDDYYFDGINMTTGTPNAVQILADSSGTKNIYDVKFGTGTIGNLSGKGVYCTEGLRDLDIDGANFVNIGGWGIDFTGSNTTSHLRVRGCGMKDVGDVTVSTGGIQAQEFASAIIAEVGFKGIGNTGATAISLLGTNVNATVSNSTFDGCTNDISKAGTYSGKYKQVGNASNNAAVTTRDILELSDPTVKGVLDISASASGQIKFPASINASADANTLDAYEEGSFTPAFSFGGASVGLTYTTQLGKYTRIGNRILFSANVVLSAKGSSTGDARIDGLPYANGAGFANAVAARVSAMAAATGDTSLSALIATGATSILFYKMASGAATTLQDTDCGINTNIHVSGTYQI